MNEAVVQGPDPERRSATPRMEQGAARENPLPEPYTLDLTVIMPTVDFGDDFTRSARRVIQSIARFPGTAEFIVVLDGPAVMPPTWLDCSSVTTLATGARRGPAYARNDAAKTARGRVLVFVDADVELAPDVLERVVVAFGDEPELVGVFGSYDDEPAVPGLVSQFRNLLHHHTHVSHRGRATTFWTGCGAMRTAHFLAAGGFDPSYSCPSVEDIDLGTRVTAAGGRIVIDPSLQCKHLKRWTLGSMIHTDVFGRAVPWTRMLLSRRQWPATLAIDWRSRVSGLLAMMLVTALIAAPFASQFFAAATGAGLALVICQHSFYRLCLRKRGLLFALGAVPLHVMFFVYSSITFAVVVVADASGSPGRQTETLKESA
jgi:GT2 family glycosyltransferase